MKAIEKETIINYNEEEKTASVYTYNKTLQNKLSKLMAEREGIKLIREGDGWKEFIIPKKWCKISVPKILSESQRAALSERAKTMAIARQNKKSS